MNKAWKREKWEWPQASTMRRILTIIIRVMTGFILYYINFTRNNFTNHDISLLWSNPLFPSDDNDDMTFLLSNLIQTTLYKTKLCILPHTHTFYRRHSEPTKSIIDEYKKMMWLSHHKFKTLFVTRVYYEWKRNDI